MKRLFNIIILVAFILNAAGIVSLAQSSKKPAKGDGWVSIFNSRNFDGWYSFLTPSGKNKDPHGVFKVEKGGIIHIFDIPIPVGPVTRANQERGYLATEKEYSHCRISLEFKWGGKRFPPFEEDKRDSGLGYYFVGPDKVWPRALENQIQETDVGDLWILDGLTITTKTENPNFPMYVLSGPLKTQSSGRIIKSGDFEDRKGWNHVEVILDGDKVTQLVNGTVVMRAWDIKQPDQNDPTKKIPLTSGRLFLQAETAEIYFRNIRMKPLP
jgi:hypothetical protein